MVIEDKNEEIMDYAHLNKWHKFKRSNWHQ